MTSKIARSHSWHPRIAGLPISWHSEASIGGQLTETVALCIIEVLCHIHTVGNVGTWHLLAMLARGIW